MQSKEKQVQKLKVCIAYMLYIIHIGYIVLVTWHLVDSDTGSLVLGEQSFRAGFQC